MKKIIEVTGMHCGNCSKAVEKALCAIDGIKSAKADHEKNKAVATMKKDVDDKLIIEAIEALGFTAGEITIKEGLFS